MMSSNLAFIGIDGCKDGWFCVAMGEKDNGFFRLISDEQSLGEFVSQARSVLIDIPIGLLDNGTDERQCDKEARKLLRPKRASSVFPAPARQTLSARNYRQAQEYNRKANGRGLSQQSWAIVPKIREIDNLLSSNSDIRGLIRECHPELCFWSLNGKKAMQYSKKTEQGRQERLTVLEKYFKQCHQLFEHAASGYLRRQLAYDDIIDAMVCAVTAKYGYSNYTTVPPEPARDASGLAMEIVYYEI